MPHCHFDAIILHPPPTPTHYVVPVTSPNPQLPTIVLATFAPLFQDTCVLCISSHLGWWRTRALCALSFSTWYAYVPPMFFFCFFRSLTRLATTAASSSSPPNDRNNNREVLRLVTPGFQNIMRHIHTFPIRDKRQFLVFDKSSPLFFFLVCHQSTNRCGVRRHRRYRRPVGHAAVREQLGQGKRR